MTETSGDEPMRAGLLRVSCVNLAVLRWCLYWLKMQILDEANHEVSVLECVRRGCRETEGGFPQTWFG